MSGKSKWIVALIAFFLLVFSSLTSQAEPQISATSPSFQFNQPVCFAPCQVAFEARLDGQLSISQNGIPAAIWTFATANPNPGTIRTSEYVIGTSALHTFPSPGAYIVTFTQWNVDGSVKETKMIVTVLEDTLLNRTVSLLDNILGLIKKVWDLLPIKIIVGG